MAPSFRTLRAANVGLYGAATLFVWGAAAYVLLCRDAWAQQLTAVAAGLISLAWGGYYVRLRYTVDALGVTRRGLFRTEHVAWAGADIELKESSTQETRSQTLIVRDKEREIRLSSDELQPEQVEDLVSELKEVGMLKPTF